MARRGLSAARLLVFAATAAGLFSATGTRMAAPASGAMTQLRVTRQVQTEDERGAECGRVYVAGGTITQERLDSLVVAGRCPELLFTEEEERALFDRWRARSLPVEIHVDDAQESKGEGNGRQAAGSDAQVEACAARGSREPAAGERDNDYIESYGNLEVHQLMLQDRVRCAWFQGELERACSVVPGAVVLDVGCGSGLLALFAARAGASKVYAVESNRRMAALAQAVVADNGLESRIRVVHGRVEDVDLPEVDIIVSEWMGFYLLHESMLDSVLVARDRFLKPGSGVMIPQSCRLLAAPVSIPTLRAERVGFWTRPDHTYGFNFSSAAVLAGEDMSATPLIQDVPHDALLSAGQVVWQADLLSLSIRDLLEISKPDLEFTLRSRCHEGEGVSRAFDGIDETRALDGICLWWHVAGPSMHALLQCAARKGGGKAGGGSAGGASVGVPGEVRTAATGAAKAAATGLAPDARSVLSGSVLSSGPGDAKTHWKQTVVSLPHSLPQPPLGDGRQGAQEGEVWRIRCGLVLRRAVHQGVPCSRQYLLSLTVSEAACQRQILQGMQEMANENRDSLSV